MLQRATNLVGRFVGITTFGNRNFSGRLCRVTNKHVFLVVFVTLSVFRVIRIRISNIRSIRRFPSCPVF